MTAPTLDRPVRPRLLALLSQAPALSLASQVAGVLQLAALLWRYGPTNATDAYFYLFNLGNLPIQILVVGVFYPMLLSEDRITRRSAVRFMRWVPVAGVAAVGAGSLWLAANGRVDSAVWPIIVLAGTNAIFQAMVWTRAVSEEAGGDPRWVAAVALPANSIALLLMLAPWPSSAATVTAMLAGLVVGNAALFVAALVRRTGGQVIAGLPPEARRKHRAQWWFSAKAGVSYGGMMIVQSLSLTLPPSALTLASVPMKIVGSVSATFVNAIMPRLVHQSTESSEAGSRFLKVTIAALAPTGLVGFVGIAILFPGYRSMGGVIALWLLVSASAAVAQRMAFRFLPPSASKITLGIVPAVVVAVAISVQFRGFGVIALLCAYACVDAFSSTLWLFALRERLMAAVAAGVSVVLVLIWVLSLT